MTPWVTLISSLGAAIIGGLVAPLVTQRRERVAARAEVRRALTDVEALRIDQDRYQEFTRALSAFEASAILAGLPRGVVAGYMKAVEVHRRSTRFEHGIGPNGEDGWAITHGPVTEAHELALERLGSCLWHPWLGRRRR
jgi:hypothetical protein